MESAYTDMRNILSIALAAVVWLSCSKEGDDDVSKPAKEAHDMLEAFQQWAEGACACKTRACADHQYLAMAGFKTTFSEVSADIRRRDDRVTAAPIDEAYRRGHECLSKFDFDLLAPGP